MIGNSPIRWDFFLQHLATQADRQAEFFDYLRFRYIRCVLPDMPGEEYLDSPNLVARLTLPTMRWPPELKLAVCASAIRGLATLESNPDRQAKYTAFIDIYADLDNNERMLFEQQYRQEDAAMAGSMYRFAEQHENIGLQKGLEQGQHDALLATARNLILKTSMDNATIADLTGLPAAEIQTLRERETGR